jgi:hypothetical protein
VQQKGNLVNVYKSVYEGDANRYAERPIYTTKILKMYVGKSPLNDQTRFSGGHGPKFDGTFMDQRQSICLHSIKTFQSKEIVKYVSSVGNSDVPYPYAIDVDGNYHLMLENVTLKMPAAEKDPYSYFYQASLITADRSFVPPKQPLVPKFMGITAWYIGNEPYTMTYELNPAKNYSRWIPSEAPQMS